MLRNIPGSGQCGSVDFRDELTRDFHLLSAFRHLVIRPPGLVLPFVQAQGGPPVAPAP